MHTAFCVPPQHTINTKRISENIITIRTLSDLASFFLNLGSANGADCSSTAAIPVSTARSEGNNGPEGSSNNINVSQLETATAYHMHAPPLLSIGAMTRAMAAKAGVSSPSSCYSVIMPSGLEKRGGRTDLFERFQDLVVGNHSFRAAGTQSARHGQRRFGGCIVRHPIQEAGMSPTCVVLFCQVSKKVQDSPSGCALWYQLKISHWF